MFAIRTTSTLFTALFTCSALFSASSAVPSAKFARDTWNPPVLTPNAQEGWVIGTVANVTWDTSDPPELITKGTLVALVKGGIFLPSGPGSTSEPLAKDFDILDGSVSVTVPDIEPGDDYQIVLFGSSGNLGPVFNITEPISNITTPVVNATEPGFNATSLIVNATEPVCNNTSPVVNTTGPVLNTTSPVVNATEPVFNVTEPAFNATNPVINTTEPVFNVTEPVFNATGRFA